MKTDRFPGATYVDARLDGQVAVLFPEPTVQGNFVKQPFMQLRDRQIMLPNQLNIQTNPLGDLPLYHRVPRDGDFRIAAQVADRDPAKPGKGTWEWTPELGWVMVDPYSYGVNATIYRGPTLYISNPGWGSQGFRYWDHLSLSSEVIRGDWTVNDQTSWAVEHHVTGLYEWTQLGGITVGQGANGGCIAVINGNRYLIEPGAPSFIRFDSDGENCVVSIVKLQEGQSVIKWFTRTELLNDFFPPEPGASNKQPGPIVQQTPFIFPPLPVITSGPSGSDVPS